MTIKQLHFVVTRAGIALVIPIVLVVIILGKIPAIEGILATIAGIFIGTKLVEYVLAFSYRTFERYPNVDPDQITVGHIIETEKAYWANRLRQGRGDF